MRRFRILIAVSGVSCLVAVGFCYAQGVPNPTYNQHIKPKHTGSGGDKATIWQPNAPTAAEQVNKKYPGILINPKTLSDY
jgi:hypothetical protein